jgi:3-oxoacyl-[acyl-carrier-protein] synthase-1
MSIPIAVRGWGSVSALGADTATAVEGLRSGLRGLGSPRRSPHLQLTEAREVLVGEVPLELPAEQRARALLDRALDEALEHAGPGRGRVGVFAGTTGGFFVDAEVTLLTARLQDPQAWPSLDQRGQGAVAERVAHRLNATGPVLTYAMACTSSAAAVAAAGEHLRAGSCDRAVVVGFDMLSNLTVRGFRGLMLYDPEPCRPFDLRRRGLQLGEGCGALVLERGEGPWQLCGWSNHMDPGNLTASSTDGRSAAAVMEAALNHAGLEPAQVTAIKAHGTGTVDNDLGEGRGIARLFGPAPPPFASLKGALGHSLGAAGCLELVLWLAAQQVGFIPGSVGFEQPDPDIGVQPARGPQPAPGGAQLLGAFGFGGSCVALVVRRG